MQEILFQTTLLSWNGGGGGGWGGSPMSFTHIKIRTDSFKLRVDQVETDINEDQTARSNRIMDQIKRRKAKTPRHLIKLLPLINVDYLNSWVCTLLTTIHLLF